MLMPKSESMPKSKTMIEKIPHFMALMRMEKPIGWLLLLWPTLWALWIAGDGAPEPLVVWVIALGVIVMRSAGCVINDYADREFDSLVERTKQRPIAAGLVQPKEALVLFALLCFIALLLLLLLPVRVWPWSIPALAITIAYPFMKRFIQAPQLVLGFAFSFGMPVAYSSLGKSFDLVLLLLFFTNVCWVILFDTAYAMSDKEDDLKIGVKSTAILFGRFDKVIIGLLQAVVVMSLVLLMALLALPFSFSVSIAVVIGLFIYQQWLIKDRDRTLCFQAFINNGWVGAIVWFGLVTSL